ncbi:hypothetical protein [Methylococcus sp. EFPC2]|uniref:hypothetical protein n=1 Tax=Methylococcus sp. EFPC2 TaxID=2812648 RepID=UPI00196853D3|nr:hypothetical protein [Methylococcus sp. EFPC2]QSA95937.1 hypothetical protein JWZ97_11880 [Methylococcus sp. EFPC2]
MNDYLQTSTRLLRTSFDAKGENLTDLVADIDGELPKELASELLALDRLAHELAQSASDPDALADFAFRCGQAQERIAALSQGYQFERLGFVPTSTLEDEDVGKIDLDAIARLAEFRDRILKTIADFTLKFLVVAVLLLFLGLALGLI